MTFHIIDHEQGSIPWLRWRHDGIGGSDTPALMGQNPWRSAKALFNEKAAPSKYGPAGPAPAPKPVVADLFAVARTPQSPPKPPPPDRQYRSAASRGTALEPYARELYNRHIDGDLQPMCLQSIDLPWQRASLDGFCSATQRVLEIKCGDKVYAHVADKRSVPAYYIGQLQHILAVCGFASIDFWVWLPGKLPLLLNVPRDEAYIAQMTAMQTAFWARVEAARAG